MLFLKNVQQQHYKIVNLFLVAFMNTSGESRNQKKWNGNFNKTTRNSTRLLSGSFDVTHNSMETESDEAYYRALLFKKQDDVNRRNGMQSGLLIGQKTTTSKYSLVILFLLIFFVLYLFTTIQQVEQQSSKSLRRNRIEFLGELRSISQNEAEKTHINHPDFSSEATLPHQQLQLPQGHSSRQSPMGLDKKFLKDEIIIQHDAFNTGQYHDNNPVVENKNQKGTSDFDKLQIPRSFENIANFPSELQPGDVPLFWHIPKSGGSLIKDMLAGCFQMTIADEVGGQFGHAQDETLQVFKQHGAKFVNVDTTSKEGIAKAKKFQIASSGLVDAIVTPFLHEASELFSPDHKGVTFTVMRDPFERAVSLLGYLGKATWEERYDPAFATMTLEEYVQSGRVNSNWMTRWLSKQYEGEVSAQHLDLAKEILRTKFVIGLLPELGKSLEHFEKYFGWQILNRPHRKKCVEELISGGSNRNNSPRRMPSIGSREYDVLMGQFQLDIELYRYAQQLFQEQSDYFDRLPLPESGTLK